MRAGTIFSGTGLAINISANLLSLLLDLAAIQANEECKPAFSFFPVAGALTSILIGALTYYAAGANKSMYQLGEHLFGDESTGTDDVDTDASEDDAPIEWNTQSIITASVFALGSVGYSVYKVIATYNEIQAVKAVAAHEDCELFISDNTINGLSYTVLTLLGLTLLMQAHGQTIKATQRLSAGNVCSTAGYVGMALAACTILDDVGAAFSDMTAFWSAGENAMSWKIFLGTAAAMINDITQFIAIGQHEAVDYMTETGQALLEPRDPDAACKAPSCRTIMLSIAGVLLLLNVAYQSFIGFSIMDDTGIAADHAGNLPMSLGIFTALALTASVIGGIDNSTQATALMKDFAGRLWPTPKTNTLEVRLIDTELDTELDTEPDGATAPRH